MSGTILSRLVWKEYRLLRGFWGAMLLAAVMAQLYAIWQIEGAHAAHWVFVVGVGLTACYALGYGATAFAGELETGTAKLQRLMPVTGPELLLGKTLFGTISTFALGLLVWLIAATLVYLRWHIHGGSSGLGTYLELAALSAFKSLELLAWGIFFSLVLGKPLKAVVYAALTTAAVTYLSCWLLLDFAGAAPTVLFFPSFFGGLTTLVPRAVLLALVVVLDVRLAKRWMHEDDGESSPGDVREARRKNRARWIAGRVTWSPVFERLLWQTLVRSRWMLITLVMTYLLLLMLYFSVFAGTEGSLLVFVLPLPIAGLMGVFVFSDDQWRHQLRFFAEHGVSPRRVWLVRQLFWGGVLLLSLPVVVALSGFSGMENPLIRSFWIFLRTVEFWQLLALVVSLPLVTFAVGQLCSQWVRSSIAATGLTVLFTIVLALWCYLTAAFGVNALWTAAPVTIGFLFATWATADDWIKERQRGRARWYKVLLVSVPILCCLMCCIGVRWLQIPAAEPKFAFAGYSEAQLEAGDETAEMYLQLQELLPPRKMSYWVEVDRRDWRSARDIRRGDLTPEGREWLTSHSDVVQRAVDTALRQDQMFRRQHPDNKDKLLHWMDVVACLLTASAQRQQENGDLDTALERHLAALRVNRHMAQLRSTTQPWLPFDRENWKLHRLRVWAAMPKQTPARIHEALEQLHEIRSLPYQPEFGVSNAFENQMQALSNVAAGRPRIAPNPPLESGYVDRKFYWCYRLMPWELARAKRLVKVEAQMSLDSLAEWRRLESSQEWLSMLEEDWEFFRMHDFWRNTTPLPYEVGRAGGNPVRFVSYSLEHEDFWRVTQLVLALEGWRSQHGRYPESLDMLVPDWLAQVPLDFWTMKPIIFNPHGRDTETKSSYYARHLAAPFILVPPHTPYVHPGGPRSAWLVPLLGAADDE